LQPSDKKKLLSLPFYLTKRQETPTPRAGQTEIALFKELTGEDWHAHSRVNTDSETKITEFDYENYLNPALIKDMDTSSPEFKEFVHQLNFLTKTKYEAHQEKKNQFAKLQQVLAPLNAEEKRALIHLIKNKRTEGCVDGKELTSRLMDTIVDESFEKELAEISEAENFALKNRYKHQRETMDFADKKRMPVDERSVRDMLRNQHIFRNKIDDELPTYTSMQESS